MKKKLIIGTVALYALAFVMSCTYNKKEVPEEQAEMEHATTDTMPSEASAPSFQVDEQFQKQLATAFTAYVGLKEAFVATDVAQVKAETIKTREALAGVDMKLLTGAAHNDWMIYLENLQSSLQAIESAADIEQQRTSFSTLSDTFYKSIKAFGLGGLTAYYEFCPMAFNNQGAYWLSDNATIRNPYFGSKMLKCGSVEEKLQ